MRERAPEAIGVAIVFFLLAFSKSIDGLPRKLQPLGIEVSAETTFSVRWKVLELGIPIYIALVAHARFEADLVVGLLILAFCLFVNSLATYH